MAAAMTDDPHEIAQRQIMGAIGREYPRFQPGQIVDPAAIRMRLRLVVPDQEFSLALETVEAIGLLRSDDSGALVLTELGAQIVTILNNRWAPTHRPVSH
jgi:hypothetical protein